MIVKPEDIKKGSTSAVSRLARETDAAYELRRKIAAQKDMLFFASGRPKFDHAQFGITQRKDGQWGRGPGGAVALTDKPIGADPIYLAKENQILAAEKKAAYDAQVQAGMSKGMGGLVYSTPKTSLSARDQLLSRSVLQGLVGGQATGRRILTGV